jgi:predicted aspartyl protease
MTCTLAVALALTFTLVPAFVPRWVHNPRDTTVPLSVYDSGAIVVPVTIAGAGPYRFLLDTGSTRSAITTRLARQLRSPVTAQTVMMTPAGSRMRSVTTVRALQIGHARQISVAAMVLPDDALGRVGRVDGLLGQDVLANLTYTIDYRRQTLVWHDGDLPRVTGHRLPLTTANGLFLVTLPNHLGAAGGTRLVVDSGADAIVLFGRSPGTMSSSGPIETGVLRTSAGLRVGRRIKLDELDLGALVLRDQPAFLLSEAGAAGLLGDGLLPLHLFARVTFDAAARALIVATR